MKVVLLTGAASGLGWALAQAYYRRGDHLLLVDLDAEGLEKRVAELAAHATVDPSPSVQALAGDICSEAFQREIFTLLEQQFGRLDMLVNNAGITHRSQVRQTDPAVFDKVMAVDWQAPVRLACQALPLLQQSQGQIVNIGSMAGWMPVLGRAGYCAAKAALAQFFEVLRVEVADDGVRILNVYPSFLDTPIDRNALGASGGRAGHARSTTGTTRSADWMAAKILAAEEAGKPWLFPDRLSWFGSVLWRLWPQQYLRSMRRRFATELDT